MLGMSFEKAIEIYLDWKTTHASTAPDRYSPRLYQAANFIGRNKPLIEITGDDVIRFHRHMEESVYEKGDKMNKYSLATVAYSARILKNFFMFWHGRGESKVNHKEILTIRYVTPLKKIVTKEDFEAMSNSFDERHFDELAKKLVVHLLWDTGMRISELRDLNIADINKVHPQYGVRTANVRTRKTMRYNLVVWSKKTDALLNKYLGIRLCIDAKTDALFITGRTEKATQVTVRTMERWIKSIVEETGLDKGITPHSFRHGKGHHILNSEGGNVRDIFAILRHVRPESSFHYLTLNQEQFLQTAVKYLAA